MEAKLVYKFQYDKSKYVCRDCSKPIVRLPFVTAIRKRKVTHGHYYHIKCARKVGIFHD